MQRWTRKTSLVLAAGALFILAACGEGLDSASDGGGADEGEESWPETISYGLTPTDDVTDLVAQYEPLETYMADCLDHPFELFTGTDYNTMIEAMRTGSVQMARFGPFAYILAHDRAGAEALAIAVADTDEKTYQSLIVTRRSNGFDELADLRGKTFAFVDPTSASGHLYPRAVVIDEMGISNDEIEDWFGEVVFAGNHEAALLSVLNGDTDAGAIASSSNEIVSDNGAWKLKPDGEFAEHPNADDFMVLAESEGIPGTVEAVQEDMPDSLRSALMDCLERAVDDPGLAEFMEEGGVPDGFVPAYDREYDSVRDTASALGMGPDDLLDQ